MDKINITIFDLFEINKMLVEAYGGAGIGFKDKNLAISAIEGCNQEVFGKILYPTIEDKIAHLVFSIVKNHIFIDGNKRTGVFVLNLLNYRHNINVKLNEKDLVIKLATSKLDEEDLANILKGKFKQI